MQKIFTDFKPKSQLQSNSAECGYSTKKNNATTYLNVPYSEKDSAKKLGAQWDPGERSWFIPTGLDSSLFLRWLPSSEESQGEVMKSSYFYLAETGEKCFKCDGAQYVYAIVLPKGFETVDHDTLECLYEQGIEVAESLYAKKDFAAIVSNVTSISPEALEAIYEKVEKRDYNKRFSTMANYSYFRNICRYCNAAHGDFFLIHECDTAFCPVNEDDFNFIKMHKISIPISLSVGGHSYGYGPTDRLKQMKFWGVDKIEQIPDWLYT